MPADPISGVILKTSAEGITKLLLEYAAKRLHGNSDEEKKVREYLEPHLDDTYTRCSKIKTLLNPHTSVDFLSIYATQRFRMNNRIVDHYSMVDLVKQSNANLIVTGSGGTGKSMFTRYLWLSMFLNGDGRIPLFVELRDLNSLSTREIALYIHHSITKGQATISYNQFKEKLTRGDFLIILDGFDEITNDAQDEIQKAIVDFSESHRNIQLILTSRPDENRFASWPLFNVVDVVPLEKRDVVELIEKAVFDDVPKKKFKKQIKDTDLFVTHQSFLSNPLLASMMLLTYSLNYDIPQKMYLFYEQAFLALYSRHDSHKPGGYKRDFKSKLSEDEFKRVFSYFCLITYYEQKFSFDRNELLHFLGKSIDLANIKVDTLDFLKDLTDCVCMLVPEGLNFVFSHRSFQEYFAAYCLAYVNSDKLEQVVAKVGARYNDEAIVLLSQMAPDAFRKKYIIPTSNKYHDALQLNKRKKNIPLALSAFAQEFVLERPAKDSPNVTIFLHGLNDVGVFVNIIERLSPRNGEYRGRNRDRDLAVIQELFRTLDPDEEGQRIIIDANDRLRYTLHIVNKNDANATSVTKKVFVGEEFDAIFEKSNMRDYLVARITNAANFVRESKKQEAQTGSAMDEIFG